VCIGAALQAIRKLQGHNQNWLARRLSDSLELNEKVEQSYISQVERGKKGISMLRWVAWCQVLGCDPEIVIRLTKEIAIEKGKRRGSKSNANDIASTISLEMLLPR